MTVVLAQTQAGAEIPADRMRVMRAMADAITIKEERGGTEMKLKRLDDPVYRYNDPARQFSDGSIWAWGESGRPAALFTLAKQRTGSGNLQWVCEMTSLAPGPLSAEIGEDLQWKPVEPGVVMRPIPQAPAPLDTEPKRLRQMRELARKFRAVEYFAPGNSTTEERYELRTLPQPIHRYSDPASGLIDGSAFAIAYGLNPEIILLIEARKDKDKGKDKDAAPTWSYGMARVSIARLHVDYDGQTLWEHVGGFSKGPHEPYWGFSRPAAP
jgi:hypothetical protein